jgi:hypothetical protein
MKQETQGKIFVGMIISVLAFGFATGTGIFIGANPLNSIGVLNLTNQGEFPAIYTTPNNVGTTNKANTTQTTQTKTTTPTTRQNSSETPTKPVSNNTSNNNSVTSG